MTGRRPRLTGRCPGLTGQRPVSPGSVPVSPGSAEGGEELVIVVVLMALAPPGVFIVRPVLGRVWRSPLEAAEVVRRFGPSVAGAILAYGVGAALVRMLETTLLGRPLGAGWDVLLLLLGAAGAGAPWLLRRAPSGGRRA